MKKFIKNHPIFFTIIVIFFCALAIYLYLLIQVFRPLNLLNGRWESNDKTWSEIHPKFQLVHIGDNRKKIFYLLGSPDQKIFRDTSILWVYEQYGVIAPGLVFEVEFRSDTVCYKQEYRW
jgi:hypothetical protein